MFIKLLIYLGITMIILAGGNMVSPYSARTLISDKTLTAQTAQLDNALIKYYATHEELPGTLSTEFMELMGLHGVEVENFSYTPRERSYTLKTTYSTGQKASAYSDRILPEFHTESGTGNGNN